MKTSGRLRRVLVPGLLLSAFTARAELVFGQGFESYPVDAKIHGQPAGSGAWKVSGAIAGDLAQVTDATAAEGAQSLLLADNGGNRPRASIDLATGGRGSAPVTAGAVSFAICEDANDGGAPDAFTINLGAMTLTRGYGSSLWFGVTGGGGRTVPFAASGHTYTPGAWNTLRVEFDDATKSATLFINGKDAGTITGSSADFTVGSLTLGTFSSGSINDALFFDALEVTSADAGKVASHE